MTYDMEMNIRSVGECEAHLRAALSSLSPAVRQHSRIGNYLEALIDHTVTWQKVAREETARQSQYSGVKLTAAEGIEVGDALGLNDDGQAIVISRRGVNNER